MASRVLLLNTITRTTCHRPLNGSSFLAQCSNTRQLSLNCCRYMHCCLPEHINSKQARMLTIARIQCNISRFASNNSSTCWKCGIQNESIDLFCIDCNTLQKPDIKSNHFNTLGINQCYDVNVATLTRKYYQLQNVLHPDRFNNKSEEEKKISEDYSSLVNKAYFTLLSPLSRGLYMLELNGIFIEEAQIQSSPDFLMEIMERNEEVDQAQGNAQQLNQLLANNKTSLEKLDMEASNAFNSGNIKEAEAVIIKMKYYASIDGKIKEVKQKDGLGD